MRPYALAVLALILLSSAASPAVASRASVPDAPVAAPPAATVSDVSPPHAYFTEVGLVDQDGNKVNLYRDLIRGKVVIMNAFYTSCESICPMVSQVLSKIQARLGDDLGREVHMISITLDPKVDSPATLAKYAKELGAKPGWRFVTGKRDDVDLALRELGFSVADRESHTGILLVVNEPRGLWRKAFGLSSPAEIEKILEDVRTAPATPH